MNIKQLKFTQAVVEQKSFSLAAKKCFVSQPTLSNSIQALEKEFGHRLFIRTTRKVELSPFGREILPYISSILNAEKALFSHIEKSNSTEKNIIRLGVSPLINSEMIMLIMEAYKKVDANCEILVNEINLHDLQQQLSDELLDIIFVPVVPREVSKNTHESIILYEEPLHVIMQDSKPTPPNITLYDIQEETILMVPDSCGLSIITRGLLESSSKSFKEYGGKAISYHVLANWAYSGLGVALLPKSKIPECVKNSANLSKGGNEVHIQFEAIWHNPSTVTQNFLSFLKMHIENITPGLA